jgi:ABC-type lipoprotein release transport system permease subunit
LSFAREFFEYEKNVSYLEVKVDSIEDVDEVKEAIAKIVGTNFTVKNRLEQQSSIFEMFKKEKRSTFAILMLILVIATFNLIGALTMMVLEKKKDLGTFKSLGGTKRLIRRIYYFEGITISLIGALLGMVLGVALVMSQTKFHLLKLENSIVEHYPVELMGSDLVLILFVTLLLGLLTSIYPAKMAAREIGS